MIIYLPAVLSALSLLVAYGSAGRRRQAATIGAIIATGWSLVVLVDVNTAGWAIGPIVATLLLPRSAPRVNSSFEGLTRRVITIAAALVAAIFLASRLPVGENPVLLSAVPWFLGALGAAWFASPVDQPERLQGQVLMLAAAARRGLQTPLLVGDLPFGSYEASDEVAIATAQRWRMPSTIGLTTARLALSERLCGIWRSSFRTATCVGSRAPRRSR